MNFLKIKNNGLIDVQSLTLLGASSKRGDTSKIGMFGSGNKYALAYLLRNNYQIHLYSGMSKIEITTKEAAFRDKKYDVICIDGKETSITTEFGKDWQLWQAIREIYCNSIDEGGHAIEFVNTIAPNEGETHFYIRNQSEISSFVANFDMYFSENKKVVFECSYGKIIEKTGDGLNLYRKGIRCFESTKQSIYDYDLANIEVDENRLVKYSWQVQGEIWNLIYQCTDKNVIRTILFGCHDNINIEYFTGDYNVMNPARMSDEYKEVLTELSMAPSGMAGLLNAEEQARTVILPNIIFQQAKAVVKNENLASKFKIYQKGTYREIETSPLYNATINKAIDFFRECKYEEPLNYDIRMCIHEDKGILGLADIDESIIYLTQKCLEMGVQSVIETIIEEYIHIKYKVHDETRGFQDASIRELVNALKIKTAYLV